jgi:hypothetical protein
MFQNRLHGVFIFCNLKYLELINTFALSASGGWASFCHPAADADAAVTMAPSS